MTKIPKLILFIVALTAIFLWLSTAFNSCGSKADDSLLAASDAVDDFEEGIDDFADDSDDDIFDIDDEDEVTEEDFTIVEEAEETDFTNVDPTPVARDPKPAPKVRSTSDGIYMVIAGNYLVESNARAMIKKLSNLGYQDAEVGVFDRSQYHTVIAARYNDFGKALEVENAIKRKGIDCYVKKRQY